MEYAGHLLGIRLPHAPAVRIFVNVTEHAGGKRGCERGTAFFLIVVQIGAQYAAGSSFEYGTQGLVNGAPLLQPHAAIRSNFSGNGIRIEAP